MSIKTRNIVMYVAVGLIFVAAIVFLIIGISTHDEPVFMHEGKSWESMPLTVACAGYVDSRDDDCEMVEDVIDRINGRLGFRAYVLTDTGSPRVTITIGVPAEQGWMDPGGDAELSFAGEHFTSCAVRTSNTGTNEMLFLTLHHELGHCLDLAHDDYEQSIMRPVQRPTPDRTIPPWISDMDRAALRGLYGAD